MSDAPARYRVLLTDGTEQDLESIYDYIAEFDSVASADSVLDQLMEGVDRLAVVPERGSSPKELLDLGIRDDRQIAFKPWRLIYRVRGRDVFACLIVDERRNLQAVLARRLLRD